MALWETRTPLLHGIIGYTLSLCEALLDYFLCLLLLLVEVNGQTLHLVVSLHLKGVSRGCVLRLLFRIFIAYLLSPSFVPKNCG